jgi:hypothetical protein
MVHHKSCTYFRLLSLIVTGQPLSSYSCPESSAFDLHPWQQWIYSSPICSATARFATTTVNALLSTGHDPENTNSQYETTNFLPIVNHVNKGAVMSHSLGCLIRLAFSSCLRQGPWLKEGAEVHRSMLCQYRASPPRFHTTQQCSQQNLVGI